MELSRIAHLVAEDILAGIDVEVVEVLALSHDRTLRSDELDEIYDMITEGDVRFVWEKNR